MKRIFAFCVMAAALVFCPGVSVAADNQTVTRSGDNHSQAGPACAASDNPFGLVSDAIREHADYAR